MTRFLFILGMTVAVVAALFGGNAFIQQRLKLNALERKTREAEEKLSSKSPEDAIPVLEKIEQDGGTPRSLFLLARTNYERGHQQKGMELFRRIPSKYPRTEYVSEAALYEGRYALEVDKSTPKATEAFLNVIAKFPDTAASDWALLYLARIAYDEGNDVQARRNVEVITKKQESPAKSEAEFLLGDLNMKQLRSMDAGPGDEIHVIQKGDRLLNISKKYNVPMDLIIAINNVNPSAMSIGRPLKIPRLAISVLVDKKDKTLTLLNGNQLLKKYHVGINSDEKKMPAGDYVVGSKTDKPEYIDPGTGNAAKTGASDNLYGSYLISLRRDISIHGTNNPGWVGTYTPRGSITMKNEDAKEVYGLVQANKTRVIIRGRVTSEDPSSGKKS